MHALTAALGHPERRLKFIHLAGTNGKGSTAAFVESILREAGHCTGLYTSPHLVSVRERLQVNGAEVMPEDFARVLSQLRVVAEKENLTVSFFEALTAAALIHFAETNVEWVVWETGLGGRLDATNIVTPEVCVITSIGWDHMEFLGNTLGQIAAEKAGILKPGVSVVCGTLPDEARDVIEARAEALGCRVIEAGTVPEDWSVGLCGAFQRGNAACAWRVTNIIKPDLTEEIIRRGLSRAHWPGRFQILREQPPLVLDGAHNPEGAKVLAAAWRERFGEARAHLVTGAVRGKEHARMYAALSEVVEQVTLVPLASDRSVPTAELRNFFADKSVTEAEGLADVWPSILKAKEPVLVAGSLFLIGEALSLWRGGTNGNEFALNERLTPASSKP
jgi:dihydrofolate synthase/folylpolyglutamate synthase